MSAMSKLPVAVIGAGPVGLAAAVHLLARGLPVKLYEAGPTVATYVRDWGHVRLFSPWRFNIDDVAKSLLRAHGWQEPSPDALPTGREFHDEYLEPLARIRQVTAVLETEARVRAVSRRGIDKVVSRNRASHPFTLAVESERGDVRVDLARAVIDASGTWHTPNPLGAAGTPAVGETANAGRISYGLPDVLGTARASCVGKRVLVVGGGHSAANVLLDLARLSEGERITWAVRSRDLTRVFGGEAADKLPARGKLGSDLKKLVESDRLSVVLGFSAEHVDERGGDILVSGRSLAGAHTLGPFDRIIVATGQRPNLDMTRELRLELDPWLESPCALGPLIDPNLHSCGTVPPHGYKELSHPEPDYFAVGIKSYGRAPTFLMATGYEQVRSVAAHLAGDRAAADDVRLVLPETGVCSASLAVDAKAVDGCCGGAASAAADVCCAEDVKARERPDAGCGCTPAQEALDLAAERAPCCGSPAAHA